MTERNNKGAGEIPRDGRAGVKQGRDVVLSRGRDMVLPRGRDALLSKEREECGPEEEVRVEYIEDR